MQRRGAISRDQIAISGNAAEARNGGEVITLAQGSKVRRALAWPLSGRVVLRCFVHSTEQTQVRIRLLANSKGADRTPLLSFTGVAGPANHGSPVVRR